MISVRNHRKHIISPTKHWGGSSKFHHPKHWGTSGVVHHQIRLKPPKSQNHKIPLNSACEVVEHGICINLSTRFLCQHNLHHLLGDSWIRCSNPQQRHGEPWWNRMNILHTAQWKRRGNVLGESRVTLRKKKHWKESWGENYCKAMHNIHVYNGSPNLKKVCPIRSRVPVATHWVNNFCSS